MKYVKPEMEVVELDVKVFTDSITVTSNENDIFDINGEGM